MKYIRKAMLGSLLTLAISAPILAQAQVQEGTDRWARLRNPLNEDWTILRPTLLVGLLQNAALNLNRQASAVRLFEKISAGLNGHSPRDLRHRRKQRQTSGRRRNGFIGDAYRAAGNQIARLLGIRREMQIGK